MQFVQFAKTFVAMTWLLASCYDKNYSYKTLFFKLSVQMPIFEEKLDHIGLERSASCSCVLIDLSLSCFSVFLSFFSFILFFPRKVDSFFFSFFSSTLSSPSENSENYLSCFGAGGRVGTKGTQRGPSRT